jgi:hypothetical protein
MCTRKRRPERGLSRREASRTEEIRLDFSTSRATLLLKSNREFVSVLSGEPPHLIRSLDVPITPPHILLDTLNTGAAPIGVVSHARCHGIHLVSNSQSSKFWAPSGWGDCQEITEAVERMAERLIWIHRPVKKLALESARTK